MIDLEEPNAHPHDPPSNCQTPGMLPVGRHPTRHDPFLVTLGAAVLSCGVLVLAVAMGWFGPDVGRGANFCEAARSGLVKQPANTWSNLGFVFAGLAIGWRAGRASGMPRAMATTYGVLVVLLGPGSAAMHATQSACGGHLDLLSMFLLASFAAAWALARKCAPGHHGGVWALLFVTFLICCELASWLVGSVPVFLHAGNAAFAALLLVAVIGEISLRRRTEIRYGVAALGTMLVAFAIWNASQHGWCDPHSLWQGHAAWHLLGAVAAWFLFLLYASEPDAPGGRVVG